tara:strand:+ start:2646 stop:3206 length:561 start_codon:yes stop_codon:yes gene_type:complete
MMTNSWSFLYDEMKYEINDFDVDIPPTDTATNIFEYNYDEHGPVAAQEVPMSYHGDDYISFNLGSDEAGMPFDELYIPDLPQAPDNRNNRWKYHEDVILKEIQEYLGGTYNAHYASPESKTQTLDLIEGIGDAEPFCRSNAIKYLSRFGKKDGKSKQDILKAIHYCILLYHFSGLCNDNPQPYETF